jgi:hypothetical protein
MPTKSKKTTSKGTAKKKATVKVKSKGTGKKAAGPKMSCCKPSGVAVGVR